MLSFDLARDICSLARIHVGKSSSPHSVLSIFSLLQAIHPCDLVKVGGSGDGGYKIPRNLSNIKRLFSPGVSEQISFDYEIACNGIPVSMIDPSVSAPPFSHPLFNFRQLALSSNSCLVRRRISFADWFDQEMRETDLGSVMVQMDIEGSEYQVIPSIPDSLLSLIEIFVVEFHFLQHLMSANDLLIMEPAISRLLEKYDVFAASPNFTCGSFLCHGRRFPKMLEVTFVRSTGH